LRNFLRTKIATQHCSKVYEYYVDLFAVCGIIFFLVLCALCHQMLYFVAQNAPKLAMV